MNNPRISDYFAPFYAKGKVAALKEASKILNSSSVEPTSVSLLSSPAQENTTNGGKLHFLLGTILRIKPMLKKTTAPYILKDPITGRIHSQIAQNSNGRMIILR